MCAVVPTDFDRLLECLHPDRHQAGKIYEDIRRKLIQFFICRGCTEADTQADLTIDRVNRLILREGFKLTGEPILLFYGVARNILHEWQRQSARPLPQLAAFQQTEESSQQYDCLESCLEELMPAQKDLILSYYQYESGKKIASREKLAKQSGMAVNALRIRVHRIRGVLRPCIERCIQAATGPGRHALGLTDIT